MTTLRLGLAVLALLCSSQVVSAQATDYAGIVMSSTGSSPLSNRVGTYPPCGTPFSCTPLQLNGLAGDNVSFFVMGTTNGLAILVGSLDTSQPSCVPLGIPGLVNSLVWVPGPNLFTLFVGVCSVPDNGRCNGGATPSTILFQIPSGLSGSVGFQALVEAPLSVGGTGFALTHAVTLTF